MVLFCNVYIGVSIPRCHCLNCLLNLHCNCLSYSLSIAVALFVMSFLVVMRWGNALCIIQMSVVMQNVFMAMWGCSMFCQAIHVYHGLFEVLSHKLHTLCMSQLRHILADCWSTSTMNSEGPHRLYNHDNSRRNESAVGCCGVLCWVLPGCVGSNTNTVSKDTPSLHLGWPTDPPAPSDGMQWLYIVMHESHTHANTLTHMAHIYAYIQTNVCTKYTYTKIYRHNGYTHFPIFCIYAHTHRHTLWRRWLVVGKVPRNMSFRVSHRPETSNSWQLCDPIDVTNSDLNHLLADSYVTQ